MRRHNFQCKTKTARHPRNLDCIPEDLNAATTAQQPRAMSDYHGQGIAVHVQAQSDSLRECPCHSSQMQTDDQAGCVSKDWGTLLLLGYIIMRLLMAQLAHNLPLERRC